MMNYIFNIILMALCVFGLSQFLPGVQVQDFVTAIWVALIISVLNAFVKPVLVFLSLPITIVTLGLFLLAINAIIIMLAAKLVDGFNVFGFWYALLFSLCLSAIQSFFSGLNQ